MTKKQTHRKTAYKELIVLGLPILVGQLGAIVTGFADNIMVGRYSTDALASASFVNNLFNMANLCAIGFTYGLTPLAGALYAVRDYARIGTVTRLALKLNVLYSLVICLIMAVVYLNLDNLGQPAHLMPYIKPYFLLVLAGLLPITIFNVLAQWSYAINNTSLPMWVILAANVINVVGNYALIYGHFGCPEMGLTGAGISTLFSRLVCMAVMFGIFLCLRRYKAYRPTFYHPEKRPGDIRLLWRTSLPVSLQMTFETGSFTLAAVMVGWLGAVPLAAYQIFIVVGTLGFCVYYSIGSAIAVKVSNAAGADNRLEMRAMAWAGYHIMLVFMVVASVVFIVAGRQIMAIFTDDPEVLALAVSLIFPLVLYQLGDATQVTFANALRGTSHVMPMLWIAFISYILIGVPATYIFCFTLGLATYGVILSFSVSLFLAGALFLTFFLRATRTLH